MVQLHVLQLPVKYSAVLDTLARVHASCLGGKKICVPHPALAGIAEPYYDEHWVEKHWAGVGRSYPFGFNSPPPEGGWDAVLHCGVGSPGNVRIETLARHAHYNKPDCTGQWAPRLDAGPQVDSLVDKEIGFFLPAPAQDKEDSCSPPAWATPRPLGLVHGLIERLLWVLSCLISLFIRLASAPRGFPTAAFSDSAPTLTPRQAGLEPVRLVQHLRGALGAAVPVELSTNAGLFVCEWTLYDSLAESARVARACCQPPRPVLFVHCPPDTSSSSLPPPPPSHPQTQTVAGRTALSDDNGGVPTNQVTAILQEVAVYMGLHRH